MKKYLKHIIFAVMLISLSFNLQKAGSMPAPDEPSPEIVATGEVVTKKEGKEYYLELISKYANEYNVSASLMEKVIRCENTEFDPLLQSKIRYTEEQIARNPTWGVIGEQEKSFGLSQIHIPACNRWEGKCITKAQATNPDFSIKFMAYKLSKNQGSMWSCYKKLAR